ncbi:MAG TPA: glycerol-3-phosphate dehydrogenase/oxidase [Albitalea sp.]|nr:glycerol-3-phosphate dehydrogenase/oxidase [Albitalea sp.]
MNRQAELAALRRPPQVDVLVVGGGIAGAGVALEAARSGAKVVLVEARDFASGTSSRSSKLVHGGLRYLAQGQFGLTRASVHERDALLRDATGLVQPLRFLLPVREGDRNGRVKLGLGLALYDRFAGRRTRRWHTAAELLAQAPPLAPQGLRGGWSYLDAQTDDARLVLRVLAEARSLGACTLNHVEVESLSREAGRVAGATLHDRAGDERFELRARCVINATGAWADALRGTLGRPPALRPLRGSHLLLPAWRLPLPQAVAMFHPVDARPVFALPWEGATLVGTTDVDHREALAQEPRITRPEFDYLMQALHHHFPALGLDDTDVLSTWSGVRPVVASGRAVDPSREAREDLVLEEDGLITVTGGKLTTFRSTALQALRLAAPQVPALSGLRNETRVLSPVAPDVDAAFADLPSALHSRWLARFGTLAPQVRAAAREGELASIGPTEVTWAELRWACRDEAVVHLDDLLLRRTRLGLLLRDGAAALLPRLQPLVQQELGWSDTRWQDEAARYLELIARCHGVPEKEPA